MFFKRNEKKSTAEWEICIGIPLFTALGHTYSEDFPYDLKTPTFLHIVCNFRKIRTFIKFDENRILGCIVLTQPEGALR